MKTEGREISEHIEGENKKEEEEKKYEKVTGQ